MRYNLTSILGISLAEKQRGRWYFLHSLCSEQSCSRALGTVLGLFQGASGCNFCCSNIPGDRAPCCWNGGWIRDGGSGRCTHTRQSKRSLPHCQALLRIKAITTTTLTFKSLGKGSCCKHQSDHSTTSEAINANKNRLSICCSSKGLTQRGWSSCTSTSCPALMKPWDGCSESTGHFPILARTAGIGAAGSAKAAGAQGITAPSDPSEAPGETETSGDAATPSALNSAFKAQSLLQTSKIWRFREVSNSLGPFLGHYHTTFLYCAGGILWGWIWQLWKSSTLTNVVNSK